MGFEIDHITMTFGNIAWVALAGLAGLGITTSTIYSLMVCAGVFRFLRQGGAPAAPAFLPPVSVLKPVHGDEPDLEQNLTSFFVQDYPDYEILFCARHSDDLGLAAARRVAARFPRIKSRILTCGEPPWPNARTYSLEIMRREALHPILVTSDSDVRVDRSYLASVVAPLRDPQVGMVTCLYRGVTRHGLWAQLEAMGMSVEMTSGVLVANMLEGMQFCLGPSMVMRQSTVEQIGGYEEVAQYYADDFVLGNWTATKTSQTVALSSYIVEHHVLNASFKKSMAHQQAWATSTRFSRPMGHIGEVLTYAVPFGLMGLIAASALGQPTLGLALFAFTVLGRALLCLLVAGCVVKDGNALRKAWIYPFRDWMGFCFWVMSYFGSRKLRYRGDPYELLPEGRLRKLTEEPAK
jgi:ceramide glucosyltransferase